MALTFEQRQYLRQAINAAQRKRRRAEMRLVGHGHERTYVAGCRCRLCCDAATEGRRGRRALEKARAANHG